MKTKFHIYKKFGKKNTVKYINKTGCQLRHPKHISTAASKKG